MSITVYVYKPGWSLLIFLQGREWEVVVPTGVQLVNPTTHTLVQETDLIGCHVLTQTLEIWRSVFFFFFFLILAALWNAETFSCGMWPLSCGMWPLSWNMWDLVLGPGKEPGPPVLEVWSLGQTGPPEKSPSGLFWWTHSEQPESALTLLLWLPLSTFNQKKFVSYFLGPVKYFRTPTTLQGPELWKMTSLSSFFLTLSLSFSVSAIVGWITRTTETCSFFFLPPLQNLFFYIGCLKITPKLASQFILGFCNYSIFRTQRILFMSFSRWPKNIPFEFYQSKCSQI